MKYKFIIDDFEVIGVEADGVYISSMKTLGSKYWDKLWNLQYIIDQNKKMFMGVCEIDQDKYKQIFNNKDTTLAIC